MPVEEWTSGEFRFPAFEACGWNFHHVADHCSPRSDDYGRRTRPPVGETLAPLAHAPANFAGRQLRLEFWKPKGAVGASPSDVQMEALRFVRERQTELLDSIIEALLARYVRRQDVLSEYQSVLGPDFPKLTALLKHREGVRSVLQFRAIYLGKTGQPTGVAVGFYGNEPLDEEHGFGVRTLSGRVLDVGGSTAGWGF